MPVYCVSPNQYQPSEPVHILSMPAFLEFPIADTSNIQASYCIKGWKMFFNTHKLLVSVHQHQAGFLCGLRKRDKLQVYHVIYLFLNNDTYVL